MRITFDPKKDERTRQERGFSLALGADVIRNRVHVFLDDRHDYGENRFVAYGYVAERLFVCVFTLRDDAYHIISLRKANDREVKKHGRRF